jgi:hypothetical protein
MKIKREYLIIAFIGALNACLHLLSGINFEYHRDELLYFSFCNHLDTGYATTPPFTGLMAFISKSIFGYSLFSTRFFPALFSGILVFLTAMIAKEFKGSFKSQVISAIGVTLTMFLATVYGIFTPYFFDIFFWTLIIFLIIRFINTSNNQYLILLGIVIGFAILNKYSVLFLLFAVLMVTPFTIHRKIFSNKIFYLGLLIALLIAMPNIIWQITHHFPVINHMKELKVSQLNNVNRVGFLIEQLIYLLPFTFIILPGIVYFYVNREFRQFRFLITISAVVILLFLILRGKSFYTSGLFPFLIVVGALFAEKVFTKKYVFNSIASLLVILGILLLPLSLPLFKPAKMTGYFDVFSTITGVDFLRKDEDGNYRKLPQVYSDMLGWNEITEKTNQAWQQVKDKNRSFIFCANYGQAGAISVIGKKFKLPEPVSFSDTYRYWLPQKFDTEISEVVYVIGTDALESKNFNDMKDFFDVMIEIGSVENSLAIEYGTKIYLFQDPKSNFNAFWKDQISGY